MVVGMFDSFQFCYLVIVGSVALLSVFCCTYITRTRIWNLRTQFYIRKRRPMILIAIIGILIYLMTINLAILSLDILDVDQLMMANQTKPTSSSSSSPSQTDSNPHNPSNSANSGNGNNNNNNNDNDSIHHYTRVTGASDCLQSFCLNSVQFFLSAIAFRIWYLFYDHRFHKNLMEYKWEFIIADSKENGRHIQQPWTITYHHRFADWRKLLVILFIIVFIINALISYVIFINLKTKNIKQNQKNKGSWCSLCFHVYIMLLICFL